MPAGRSAYVAPQLARLDAVAYALRGYAVTWSKEPHAAEYSVFGRNGLRTHGVEIRSVFPAWAHRAVCWWRNFAGDGGRSLVPRLRMAFGKLGAK